MKSPPLLRGPSSLEDPKVRSLLDRLHGEARREVWRYPRAGLHLLLDRMRGVRQTARSRYGRLRDLYLSVSPSQGRFLYLTARAVGARTVVEFGSAFGVSTIYLAAAVRDNGGGTVITTEIEEEKAAQAVAYARDAGLAGLIDMRTGDALETLAEVPEALDLVFLDGWEPLYLPVLERLAPRVRPGGVVLADDVVQYRRKLAGYLAHVRDPQNGYVSQTVHVPFWRGMEYSVRL